MYENQVATVAEDAQTLGIELYAYGELNDHSLHLAPNYLAPSMLQAYSQEDPDESGLQDINISATLLYTRLVLV